MREDDLEVEFKKQYDKSIKNFIRKWGTHPRDVWDMDRDMIIPKKYNIGFMIHNCNETTLKLLEPWCSIMYIEPKDFRNAKVNDYINQESSKTTFDLTRKFQTIHSEEICDIMVEFDAKKLNEQRLAFLQKLSDIITDSGEIGIMEYDIFVLDIKELNTYETDNLIGN